MQVIKILLFVFFVCQGCTQNVDPAFEVYYNEFKRDAKRFGVNAGTRPNINFGDLIGKNGECTKTLFLRDRIIIDRVYWDSATEEQRYSTIYHELGHSILSREHFPERFKNGLCKSIMRSSTPCYRAFFRYREYYLKELFTGVSDETLIE